MRSLRGSPLRDQAAARNLVEIAGRGCSELSGRRDDLDGSVRRAARA